MITPKKFQRLILNWFDKSGRKHLPWQYNKTPYRVWISEIMLQQTQVSTVIPYYERFMEYFPDIKTLANAHEDTVLHLWTGLGYYTRARNLHRTAKIIDADFSGKFPDEVEELEKLPGIGRSTAGAIISIAFERPAPILDGNVKRVLTRIHNIAEWPGEKNTATLLWKIAENFTPKERTADYSQAMMDLGATLCKRGKPLCSHCPLIKTCLAYENNNAQYLPRSKPKKSLPVRENTLLLIRHEDYILLQKRPPTGIWGGLWSPPQIAAHVSDKEVRTFCREALQLKISKIEFKQSFRHTFSHFHLDILPAVTSLTEKKTRIMDSDQQIWYNLRDAQSVGLPAPVKKLLRSLI